jgi:hypothetical protein
VFGCCCFLVERIVVSNSIDLLKNALYHGHSEEEDLPSPLTRWLVRLSILERSYQRLWESDFSNWLYEISVDSIEGTVHSIAGGYLYR